MTELAFALIIGFILGILVGFLVRSESRRFDVDSGRDEDASH